MPWNGIDAIDGARECLNALSEIKLPTRAHEYLGPPTLTATGIRSGLDATHTLCEVVQSLLIGVYCRERMSMPPFHIYVKTFRLPGLGA